LFQQGKGIEGKEKDCFENSKPRSSRKKRLARRTFIGLDRKKRGKNRTRRGGLLGHDRGRPGALRSPVPRCEKRSSKKGETHEGKI